MLPIGAWFWVILVLAVLFGGWAGVTDSPGARRGLSLVLIVLLALLGWSVFGSPLA